MLTERWFKGCQTEAQRAERKSQLLLSKHLFDILGEMIQEDIANVDKDMQDKQNYFMPAWSEYQASRLGKKEAFKKILGNLP